MDKHADPDLARRLHIARLLMVTACDWGIAMAPVPATPASVRSASPVRITLRNAALAWPARACDSACSAAANAQGHLRFPSLSGFAI